MLSLATKNNKRLSSLVAVSISAVIFFLSNISFALAQPGSKAAQSFVETLNEVILLPLIALLMGVAFLVFIWGCFEYIQGAANPTAREQGVKHITYGVIGLVVMVSAWAILNLAANTFGLSV